MFLTHEYITGTGWQMPTGGYTSNPAFIHTVNSSNQCSPYNQHCHAVWVKNNQNGWSAYRTFYFYPGDSAAGKPYIAVSYQPGTDMAVVSYDLPGATWFLVYEDTPGGNPPSNIYFGKAKSVRVAHQSDRSYYVSAWISGQGWTSSPWILP